MASARKTAPTKPRTRKEHQAARAARVRVTVEACVHHFSLAYRLLSQALDIDSDLTLALFMDAAKRSIVAPPSLAKTH